MESSPFLSAPLLLAPLFCYLQKRDPGTGQASIVCILIFSIFTFCQFFFSTFSFFDNHPEPKSLLSTILCISIQSTSSGKCERAESYLRNMSEACMKGIKYQIIPCQSKITRLPEFASFNMNIVPRTLR